MQPETTTYRLVYYIATHLGGGPRNIPQRSGTGRTQPDYLLNAHAYRCKSLADFRELSRTVGKGSPFWGEVLVEGSDGSRRFPTDADMISTLSPAPAVSSDTSSERLVPAGAAGAGDSAPPADNAELLMKIKNLLVEPIRVNGVAAQLGVTADEVKHEVLKPDSGVVLRAAGWLALAGTV